MFARRETDDECVERARKWLRVEQKWGKWMAGGLVLLGFALLGAAHCFVTLPFRFADEMFNPANPANPLQQAQVPGWLQAQQAAMWQQQVQVLRTSVSFGLMFGTFAGFFLYKGTHVFGHGIVALRGDRSSRLLVQYHDAIVELMRAQSDRSESASDADAHKDGVATGEGTL